MKTGNLKKKYLKKAAYLGVGIRGRFIYFSVTIFEYLTLHLVNRTARSAVNRELLFSLRSLTINRNQINNK